MKRLSLVWLSLIVLVISIPITASAAPSSHASTASFGNAVAWHEAECFSEGFNHTFLKCNIDAGISNVFLQPADNIEAINFTVEVQRYDSFDQMWVTMNSIPLNKSYFQSVPHVSEQIQVEYPNANHQDYRIKVTGYLTGAELGSSPTRTAYSNVVELGYTIAR
ncbi:hypothetical protein HQN90_36395 [Paenibacillus alba]|uniref:hypothetical protein n=1 Tax=Paenibacillus alba TaxID=1197127 RepID=UPI0015678596|nr:hypothetical protein [Paenibacillus alba]NQX71572.1 hypothetical protein [Paenibacillus alba]